MLFNEKLREVQKSLSEQHVAGWLLYDFHGCNPLAYTFLEIPLTKIPSRRFFYWIPQQGDPVKIVSMIEPYILDHLPGQKWLYRRWEELEKYLFSIAIEKGQQILMEYSPYNALPSVSRVDAGTIDLIRHTGVEVISSANLIQKYTSIWTEEQFKSHSLAADVLHEIADMTWAFIVLSLQSGPPVDEYQIQLFILHEIEKRGYVTADFPICAVNAHSADPHYSPSASSATTVCPGDFILLDLWCKQNQPHAVYADIARVGVAAERPTHRQKEVFDLVKQARDETTLFIQNRYKNQEAIEGWQVDQFCRQIIHQAGYGEYFIHRTGHNIGEEVHGLGANLDNFETHDFRHLLPGMCFSIEPGIYFPQEFGIRLEYNIFLDLNGHISITGGVQQEIVCLA